MKSLKFEAVLRALEEAKVCRKFKLHAMQLHFDEIKFKCIYQIALAILQTENKQNF